MLPISVGVSLTDHPRPVTMVAPTCYTRGMSDENRSGDCRSRPQGGAADVGPRVWEVDDTARGQRLDRFVKKRYRRAPDSLLQKLLRTGGITHNRHRSAGSTRLEVGDTVELWTDLSGFRADPGAASARARRLRESSRFRRFFRILHEDDSLLVLNKPAGLVVHPSRGHHRGDTLLDLLGAHLPDDFATGSAYRPAFIHRLDQGTSGVLVAAKTREAARALEHAFRRRRVEKVYLALAHGLVRPQSGTIELGVGPRTSERGPTRYRAVENTERSRGSTRPSGHARGEEPLRSALTHYRVEETFRRASLLRILLGTGRTHQIRVHLAAIGHPICGDGEYGRRQVNRQLREGYGLRRPALHAAEIEVPHPETGESVRFSAPLPDDLLRVLDGLRRHA